MSELQVDAINELQAAIERLTAERDYFTKFIDALAGHLDCASVEVCGSVLKGMECVANTYGLRMEQCQKIIDDLTAERDAARERIEELEQRWNSISNLSATVCDEICIVGRQHGMVLSAGMVKAIRENVLAKAIIGTEKLAAERDALRLTWTDQPPSEPGYYWYKAAICGEPDIAVTFWSDHDYVAEGYWAGPIPTPTEPQEQSK